MLVDILQNNTNSLVHFICHSPHQFSEFMDLCKDSGIGFEFYPNDGEEFTYTSERNELFKKNYISYFESGKAVVSFGVRNKYNEVKISVDVAFKLPNKIYDLTALLRENKLKNILSE